MAKNCESCIGSGSIREEGETPKEDRWRRCADCGGSGEIRKKAKWGFVRVRLTGAQGAGKTTLAREIRKAARRLGLRVRVSMWLPDGTRSEM